MPIRGDRAPVRYLLNLAPERARAYRAELPVCALPPVLCCFDEPPKATILFCEEVPPWGGDTRWAAMGPTFEALSDGLRTTLLGLSAIPAA